MNVLQSRRERGFTLVEMMVVVGIIAVLAAVVFVKYTHNVAAAAVAAAVTTDGQITLAIQSYENDHTGNAPSASAATVDATLFGGAGNQYMNATPTDAGSDFEYNPPSGTNDFVVCSPVVHRGVDFPSNIVLKGGGALTSTTLYAVCFSPQYSTYAATTTGG